MKITTFILIVSLMQVSAASFGQRVTLKKRGITLEDIIFEIRNQTGYDVLIGTNKFHTSQKIDANFQQSQLSDVMDQIVKVSGLSYTIDGRTIVIKEKESSILDRLSERFANIDVHGQVIDASDGKPLQGASITVVGSKISVTTSQSGEFHLHNVNENVKIRISYIGYITKEVKVTADLSIIKLELNNSKLDEVQVIAYGTTTRRLNTGDVTSVKSKDFENEPVTNVLSALVGRVPGMDITQISGLSGAGFKLDIRGRNSLASGSDPLYVVDGVPVPSGPVNIITNVNNKSIDGQQPTASNSPSGYILNYLNPSDIESVEILKDADATAIYGSRGGNGVVLITTKKGKAGKMTVSVNAQTGISQIPQVKNYLNTQQYLEMRREAFKNDGVTPTIQNAPDLVAWDPTRSSDLQKVLLGGTAHYTDVQASISGGASNFQYLLSSGYKKTTTIVPGSFDDTKRSLHFNMGSESQDQKFKVTLTGNLMVDDNQLPQNDPTSGVLQLAPNAPEALNPDGTINWANGTWKTNPLAYLLKKSSIKVTNWVLNTNLSYQFSPGLQLQTNIGYTDFYTDETALTPIAAQFPRPNTTITGNGYYGNNSSNTLIIEPQVNYKVSIAKGTLSILGGANITRSFNKGQSVYANGFSFDGSLQNPMSAPIQSVNSVTNTEYRYAAIFGRLNYNYQDKYILNITGRRDGSSRFGPGNRFANFGSAALAWIFTEEKFIKNALPFLSFGKLRASYGSTGNDQILDYNYLQTYAPPFFSLYNGTTGIYPTNLYNPNYQWEVNKKAQVGLDLGFLQDRFVWNISYYRNRSSNQLIDSPLPATTGFSGILVNQPAIIQNMGFESALNTVNIKTKNFNWSTSVNITIPKSRLIAYPDLDKSPLIDQFTVGQPITIKKLYHFINVDPTTGQNVFLGKDGQPTFTPIRGTDYISTVNVGKDFYGGLENNFRFKNLTLSFLLRFVKQMGYNNLYNYLPGSQLNQPVAVLNRWQKPGDITNIARFTQIPNYDTATNAFNSDLFYSDASFIRLSSLSLSYNLSDKLTKKLHLQQFRFYIAGNNLFTITHFKGVDPENNAFNSYGGSSLPPMRTMTAGIKVAL
ncbi:TonB-linked SusC/RagA family outer membrane protein [Pedobacter cryoconitis]|uniref:SusC/RagA family TonB-linked outer membrane protein n=1 Tax=Pedobacter cryoconitis TaxID=188932 RepID=UPI00161244B6|nr:SusC/RagA family TonB-linked outer membrane protein [Pedobacter cryoconitis]MBB6271882.1 TonB-linked SusC/RagA family outer membrane protein [Pedobacter cryoconitis]